MSKMSACRGISFIYIYIYISLKKLNWARVMRQYSGDRWLNNRTLCFLEFESFSVSLLGSNLYTVPRTPRAKIIHSTVDCVSRWMPSNKLSINTCIFVDYLSLYESCDWWFLWQGFGHAITIDSDMVLTLKRSEIVNMIIISYSLG